MEEFSFTVSHGESGIRLDRFLEGRLPLTRSQIKRLVDAGCVLADGRVVPKAGFKIAAGQKILVRIPDPEPSELVPWDADLTVYYEDEHLAVVEKPAGVPVHPAAGHLQDTLCNMLIAKFPTLSTLGGEERPGIVHRLDKDTSGILVVAKDERTHRLLSDMLQSRSIIKIYFAVCHGVPRFKEGLIDAPIGRHPVDRKRMAVVEGGREALTRYLVLDSVENASLLAVRILTGRTHQIRVHLHHMGNPVLGDPLYGKKGRDLIGRQALHAAYLEFDHPVTGERISVFSPPPEDMRGLLVRLGLRIPKGSDIEPLRESRRISA